MRYTRKMQKDRPGKQNREGYHIIPSRLYHENVQIPGTHIRSDQQITRKIHDTKQINDDNKQTIDG